MNFRNRLNIIPQMPRVITSFTTVHSCRPRRYFCSHSAVQGISQDGDADNGSSGGSLGGHAGGNGPPSDDDIQHFQDPDRHPMWLKVLKLALNSKQCIAVVRCTVVMSDLQFPCVPGLVNRDSFVLPICTDKVEGRLEIQG